MVYRCAVRAAAFSVLGLLLVSCMDNVGSPDVGRNRINPQACTGVTYNLYANESSSYMNTWNVYGGCSNDWPSDWWRCVDDADECFIYSDGTASTPVSFGFTNFGIPPSTQVIVGSVDVHISAQSNGGTEHCDYEVWMNNGTSDQLIASGTATVDGDGTSVDVSVVDPSSNGLPYSMTRINSLQVKISTTDAGLRLHYIDARVWGYVPGKDGCPEFTE